MSRYGDFHSITIPKSATMTCEVVDVDRVEKPGHVGVQFGLLWETGGHDGLSTVRMVSGPGKVWKPLSDTGLDSLPSQVSRSLVKAAKDNLDSDFKVGDRFRLRAHWEEYIQFELAWSSQPPLQTHVWYHTLTGKAAVTISVTEDLKTKVRKHPKWRPESDPDQSALKEIRKVIKAHIRDIYDLLSTDITLE